MRVVQATSGFSCLFDCKATAAWAAIRPADDSGTTSRLFCAAPWKLCRALPQSTARDEAISYFQDHLRRIALKKSTLAAPEPPHAALLVHALLAFGIATGLADRAVAQNTGSAVASTLQAPRMVVQSGPRNPVSLTMTLSPDKRFMATAGDEAGLVYLWQTETGRLLCSARAGLDQNAAMAGPFLTGMPRMSFSRDSMTLATANDREITLWDVRDCRSKAKLSSPGKSGETAALATLGDGQLLVADGDGNLFRGDVFGGARTLQQLPNAPHRSQRLLGLSRDGRMALTSGKDGEDVSPFSPEALRLVDLQSGAAETLADYRGASRGAGGFMANIVPPAAALSSSGRWVVESHQNAVTLYDRQTRAVVGRVQLSSPDAGSPSRELAGGVEQTSPPSRPAPSVATTQPPPPDPTAGARAQMAAILRSLPPEMRAQMEEQMRGALQGGPSAPQPQRDQRAARVPQQLQPPQQPVPDAAVAAAAAGISPANAMPSWVGFTPKEDLVLVWRNPWSRGAMAGPLKPDQRPVLELRRLPNLALVKELPISDPGAVNPEAAGVAMSQVVSPDGTLLALSLMTGDMSGGRTGVMDLTRLPEQALVRGWKPTGNGAAAIEWAVDGRLIALHSGTAGSQGAASLAGRGGMGMVPGAPGGGLPSGPRSALPPGAMPGNPSAMPLAQAPGIGSIGVRWPLAGNEVSTRAVDSLTALPTAVSPGGAFMAMLRAAQDAGNPMQMQLRLEVVSTQTLQPVHETVLQVGDGTRSSIPNGVALSPDGRFLAVLSRPPEAPRGSGQAGSQRGERLTLHATDSGRAVAEALLLTGVGSHHFMQPKMRFTADGKGLIVIGSDRDGHLYRANISERGEMKVNTLRTGLQLLDVVGDSTLRLVVREGGDRGRVDTAGLAVIRVPRNVAERDRVKVNPAGTQLVASQEDGALVVFNVGNDGLVSEAKRLEGHGSRVLSMAYSPDGRRLASSDEQGATFIWDVTSGGLLMRLFAFTDGSWAAVDSDGRFDTNNLEDLEYLHWVMPDDPLRALPLDIFMRDYFTPGLLARVMRGDTLPAVRRVTELNRAQPMVRITAIAPSREDARRVDITVETEGQVDPRGRPGGAMDLRLFRDGKLVGSPERPGEALKLDSRSNRASVTFRNIRLPQGAAAVQFSSYAFNTDRVKSATARTEYRLPLSAATGGAAAGGPRGKAYVVSIGVNTYDNPDFDLLYAANDATLAQEMLANRLGASKRYREVVAIPLVSDGDRTRNATKGRIRAVLAVLAGRPADRAELVGIANVARLEAATPDDLVVITFAGHGHAGEGGVFYLLPQDLGGGRGKQVTPSMLGRAISTDELEAWLRNVDAGEMAMVIDACHSAASVEGDGFKPGPMGSRGLGQLAYDKGIRILAASQADDVALENEKLKHGLLTFALFKDGIDARRADFRPADKRIALAEWLAYGVDGVPRLQAELASGTRAANGATRGATIVGAAPGSAAAASSRARFQQPRLFDFSRQGEGPVLEVLR